MGSQSTAMKAFPTAALSLLHSTVQPLQNLRGTTIQGINEQILYLQPYSDMLYCVRLNYLYHGHQAQELPSFCTTRRVKGYW